MRYLGIWNGRVAYETTMVEYEHLLDTNKLNNEYIYVIENKMVFSNTVIGHLINGSCVSRLMEPYTYINKKEKKEEKKEEEMDYFKKYSRVVDNFFEQIEKTTR